MSGGWIRFLYQFVKLGARARGVVVEHFLGAINDLGSGIGGDSLAGGHDVIDAGKRLTSKGIDHDLSAEQSAIEQILGFANGADAIHGDHDFAAIDVALPETIVAFAFELLHAGFELLLSLVRIWGVLIVIVRLVLTLSQ